MDTASIAAAYIGVSQAQKGQALQAAMLKQAVQADAGIVALLQGATDALASPASAPAGMGTQINITV
ncbi:hypothetical protein [Roseibium aestuarii]|uniref:Motility protein YjfB-like n=1 Tax=Roseibium aestuarii TaxID=2600299 RepID=A0ABW4K253_9HYPH|nr:hypothetical protein [Roseibium aestuarii]